MPYFNVLAVCYVNCFVKNIYNEFLSKHIKNDYKWKHFGNNKKCQTTNTVIFDLINELFE